MGKAMIIGGLAAVAALGALAVSRSSSSAPGPGPGPQPLPPVRPPPPPPPVPAPGAAPVPNFNTAGWFLVAPYTEASGRLRVAAAVTGFQAGQLPLFVDALLDYWNLVLCAPIAPDPADWPAGPEAAVRALNPQFTPGGLYKGSVVHWEGDYHGATSPYKLRPTMAGAGFIVPFAVWQATGVS